MPEITVHDLHSLESRPGFVRAQGAATDRATLVHARAAAGATSGWHHHGARDVFGYVLRGEARFEFGPNGTQHVDVGQGSSFHVPAGVVHRDVNPTGEAHEIVLVLVGEGPLVVDVDGPAA